MSDFLKLLAVGRVASVEGWGNTGSGQRVYRFDLAANRKFGDREETVYLKCSVTCPEAHQVAERGLIVGETLLIDGGWAKSYQNTKHNIIQVLVESVRFIAPLPKQERIESAPARPSPGRIIPLNKTGTESR